MTEFDNILLLLLDAKVEFVVIGGLAAIAHGSARLTFDLDICYNRANDNVRRLCAALAPIHPTLRGAPKDLPFVFDLGTVKVGLNFTLDTDLGPLDLLGEVTPIGLYQQVFAKSVTANVAGFKVSVIALDDLVSVKRSTGRDKDKQALPELEALLALQKRRTADDAE